MIFLLKQEGNFFSNFVFIIADGLKPCSNNQVNCAMTIENMIFETHKFFDKV